MMKTTSTTCSKPSCEHLIVVSTWGRKATSKSTHDGFPLGFPWGSPPLPLCLYWTTRSLSTFGRSQFTSSPIKVGGIVIAGICSPLCVCVRVRACGVCSNHLVAPHRDVEVVVHEPAPKLHGGRVREHVQVPPAGGTNRDDSRGPHRRHPTPSNAPSRPPSRSSCHPRLVA